MWCDKVRSPNPEEPDRPKHDRPAKRVIAQQYSYAIFVLVRRHSRKEKLVPALTWPFTKMFAY
jgi:hypothetical protein